MPTGITTDMLRRRLEERLSPSQVEVLDESGLGRPRS